MQKKYTYIGVAFIVLVFGTWAVPKIVSKLQPKPLVKFEKVPNFSLVNQYGKIVNNNTFKDKVYVVEFFYTRCPTICPKMNKNMLIIQKAFYGNPNFGIASISINPSYDKAQILLDYAKEKGATLKNWYFLTGNKDSIYQLSNTGFKLYAGVNDEVKGGFEHSGLFALIDKKGFIRSRTIKMGGMENPIKFYDGLNLNQVEMLKQDIAKLLAE
ncbi:MAG: SCO family protein [Flavobacteriaceae bacterium]|nr:SCO family protein [Flavobacteriaceae bacterium]